MIDMKKCRACGETVAENAKTCPHCGCNKPTRNMAKIVFICIVLALGAIINAASGG